MLLNAIMCFTMYPTVLILYFVYRYMHLDHNKYVFGVTIPHKQKGGEAIQKITAGYKREMRIVCLSTMWIPLLAFLTRHVSIQLVIWIAWLFAEVVLFMVPFIHANEKTMAYKLKLEEEIPREADKEKEQIQYVELKGVRTVRMRDFIGQLVFSILPVVVLYSARFFQTYSEFQIEQFQVYRICMLVFAITTIICVGVAYWMDARRSVVICGESSINTNFARAKKMVWRRIWMLLSALNTLLIVAVTITAFLEWHTFQVLMVGAAIESVAGIAIIWRGTSRIKQIHQTYESRFTYTSKEEDDHCWKWGIFYDNKSDKRYMVEQRVGLGMTMNMAHPAGKASMLVAVLCIIWLIPFSAWFIWEDFTPIHLVVENRAIICEHTKEEYTIPISSIQEAELIQELPDNRLKSHGTASDTLEKGKFSARNMGSFYEFLNPENTQFIYIVTEDRTYYISGYSDEETVAVYHEIE